MNNSWAKPGVRCVCIDDDLVDVFTGIPGNYVTKGGVYKIVSVEFVPLVNEAVIGLWGMPLGQGFCVGCFRPLVEDFPAADTDIALFLEIAHHAPALNEADA